MAEETPKKKTASVKDVLSREEKKPEAKPKADAKDGGKKKKHRHTHIEHHDDGSHTVRHTPEGGGQETSYAAPDLDAVHDGLEQHVGEANADEGQDMPPQAGAEPQAAQPAQPSPQPMPGA